MRPFLHIWQADLTASYPSGPATEATLSPAEHARLGRLRTPILRQTYARTHVFLRAILSRYTGQSIATVALSADGNGKPIIAGSALHFNLSYRPGRALLAVTNTGPVGADIEPLAPLADAAALLKELFSPPEQAALQAATPAPYWPLFYLIWTRKEAYAKAQGMGWRYRLRPSLCCPPAPRLAQLARPMPSYSASRPGRAGKAAWPCWLPHPSPPIASNTPLIC